MSLVEQLRETADSAINGRKILIESQYSKFRDLIKETLITRAKEEQFSTKIDIDILVAKMFLVKFSKSTSDVVIEFYKLNPTFPTKNELSNIANDLSSYLIDQGLRVQILGDFELFVSWERDSNVPIETGKIPEVKETTKPFIETVKFSEVKEHSIPIENERVFMIDVVPYDLVKGLFLTKNDLILKRHNDGMIMVLGKLQSERIVPCNKDEILEIKMKSSK